MTADKEDLWAIECALNRLYLEFCEQRLDTPALVLRRLPDKKWEAGFLDLLGEGDTLEDAVAALREADIEYWLSRENECLYELNTND